MNLLLEKNIISDTFSKEDSANTSVNVIKNEDKSFKVTYVELIANSGGAGGFHEGCKRAYDSGYEWVWLLDDDRFPEVDCLEKQFRYSQFDFISPLVLNIIDRKTLAFSVRDYRHNCKYILGQTKESIDEDIIYGAFPFNGILIYRKVFNKIGFPLKELFIWGDETEYYRRALKNGVSIITVVNALYYHPSSRAKKDLNLFGKKISINFSSSDRRNYCMFRNTFYITIKYDNVIKSFLLICLYSLFYTGYFLTHKNKLHNLKILYSALIDCMANNMNNHLLYKM